MRADVLALDLPMSVNAPGMARRAVDQLDLDDDVRGSVSLVASELVTNALVHSGAGPSSSIGLTGRILGDVLRVSVTDRGTGSSVVRPRDQPGLDGGFGLLLVDRLATRWGVARGPETARGRETTVWCELPIGTGGPPLRAGAAHPLRETRRQSRVPSP